MLALLIIGFLVIIALEVPAMAMKGQKRELRAFWVLLTIAFGLGLAVARGWPLPGPTHALEAVFRPFSELLGLK